MSIKTQPQPPFTIDTESERNIEWPDGARVYCKDTHKSYVLDNGAFILIGPGSGTGTAWGEITGTLSAQTDLAGALNAKTTLDAVKADTGIADALTKKHANTLDHSNSLDHSNANDPSVGEKSALAGTSGTPGSANKYVTDGDARNANARTPVTHSHAPGDITGTAVVTADARLSDARVPTAHSHAPADITGTAVVTADSRLSDARIPTSHDSTKHSVTYALPADISTHAALATDVHGSGANTLVYSNDAKLSDARTPLAHSHAPGDVTGTAVITADARLSDARTPVAHDNTKHSTAYAPVAAPTFTGVPAAPTPAARTNTTQIATTAFVLSEGNAQCLTSPFTTSSITAVATTLTFPIAANEVFVVDVYGTCSKATSATGLKFAIGAPSGCAVKGFQLGGGATLAAALVPSLIAAVNTLLTALATGINIEVAFVLHFRVVNGATPGAITIQVATVTGNVATVYAGTKMIYNRAGQV
jgi:hypothetical protein